MAFYRAVIGGGGGGNTAKGTFTTNTTATSGYKVTLGFKPKYILMARDYTTNAWTMAYNEDISTTKWIRGTTSASVWQNFGSNSPYSIKSIDNDGFTVYTANNYHNFQWRYFAMG